MNQVGTTSLPSLRKSSATDTSPASCRGIHQANSFLGDKNNPLAGAINNAGGGGAEGEKKEDFLDKGVDFVQERMGQGQQSDETAIEQQKDELIS